VTSNYFVIHAKSMQHTFTLDIYEHVQGQTQTIILVGAIQMSGGNLVQILKL
jgi:hypothetical protein